MVEVAGHLPARFRAAWTISSSTRCCQWSLTYYGRSRPALLIQFTNPVDQPLFRRAHLRGISPIPRRTHLVILQKQFGMPTLQDQIRGKNLQDLQDSSRQLDLPHIRLFVPLLARTPSNDMPASQSVLDPLKQLATIIRDRQPRLRILTGMMSREGDRPLAIDQTRQISLLRFCQTTSHRPRTPSGTVSAGLAPLRIALSTVYERQWT